MGSFDKLRAWLKGEPVPRYDEVRVVKIADGTTIEGHDAVAAHFDAEKKLLDEHGPSVIFQVFRGDLQATTVAEMQGPILAEIKVDAAFITGDDTVAAVKTKVRPLIEEIAGRGRDTGAGPVLRIDEADRISFSLGGRRMREDKLFYAEHFIALPVWVQVLLHACDIEELTERARELSSARAG